MSDPQAPDFRRNLSDQDATTTGARLDRRTANSVRFLFALLSGTVGAKKNPDVTPPWKTVATGVEEPVQRSATADDFRRDPEYS